MSDKTFKSYLKFSFIFKRLLNKFDIIFTKSKRDSEKFAAVKKSDKNIVTLGNIKFQSRHELTKSGIFAFLKNHNIFAAASTHSGEDEIVYQAFSECKVCDRLVIAPRHLNRVNDVFEKAKKAGLSVSLLAERNAGTDVVVIDRFGALEELFTESDKIFIGGSLNNTGGHNIFEALQFEKAICTGPNMFNFQEISDIAIKHGVSEIIKDKDELKSYLEKEHKPDFKEFFAELDKENNRKLNSLKEVLDSVSAD
jgi:3-deoxy-D-manno-octulosonic-acid transferase